MINDPAWFGTADGEAGSRAFDLGYTSSISETPIDLTFKSPMISEEIKYAAAMDIAVAEAVGSQESPGSVMARCSNSGSMSPVR